MIPKIAPKGRSFKGAARYYLHDKGAETNERVEFTYTHNLATDDPEKALRHMAYTAMNQNAIKARAGGSAKGRKLELPVYTYSLSWHPNQEPTKEQMIAAALETLKSLGVADHEAVFVAHNDEPHPHIHVILNRVNPDTGIAAKLSNDRLELSNWAEAYERRNGQILCQQRVENNKRRKKDREFVKDRESARHDWQQRQHRQRFERQLAARKDLTAAQKKRRQQLYEAKEKLIAQEREHNRQQFKHYWRGLYLNQKQARARLRHRQRLHRDQLRDLLKIPGGIVLRREDAARKGHLSPYFNDEAKKSRLPSPKEIAEKEDKTAKLEAWRRSLRLKDILEDKRAIHRPPGERGGRLSGHFGDKAKPIPPRTARSSDVWKRYSTFKSDLQELLEQQKQKRNALAANLRDKDLTAFRVINKLYKEQLAELEKVEQRERGQLGKDQASERFKDDFGRASGKDSFDEEYGKDEPYFGDEGRDMTDDYNDDFDNDSPPHKSVRKPPKGPDRGR